MATGYIYHDGGSKELSVPQTVNNTKENNTKEEKKPGNFWDNLNKVLGNVGETASTVSEGVTSIDRAVNPDSYQSDKVVVQSNDGQLFSVVAWIAGGALVVFAISKLT